MNSLRAEAILLHIAMVSRSRRADLAGSLLSPEKSGPIPSIPSGGWLGFLVLAIFPNYGNKIGHGNHTASAFLAVGRKQRARARHIQKKGENSICNRSKSQEIKVATELVTDFQLSVTIKLGEIEGRPYGRPGCNNHCSPVDVGVIVPRRIC